jgi:hypothetical protein
MFSDMDRKFSDVHLPVELNSSCAQVSRHVVADVLVGSVVPGSHAGASKAEIVSA